jgi:hypothetical protein
MGYRNIKYSVDPATYAAVIATLKKVPTSTKAYPNARLEAFLRCDSPPLQFVDLESPPIFPRNRSINLHLSSSSRNSFQISDLATHAPLVEIEEEDPYMEHLVVVNGWRTDFVTICAILAKFFSQKPTIRYRHPPRRLRWQRATPLVKWTSYFSCLRTRMDPLLWNSSTLRWVGQNNVSSTAP